MSPGRDEPQFIVVSGGVVMCWIFGLSCCACGFDLPWGCCCPVWVLVALESEHNVIYHGSMIHDKRMHDS